MNLKINRKRRGIIMQFVKSEHLSPGMRLAKPIYNKMGVLLYERETELTQQSIISIRNFGLIGIYVLEPAEPAPPLTAEDIDFERFQTIHTFRLKEDLDAIKAGRQPTNLKTLVPMIIKNYGSLDHKFFFNQNIRSTSDYIYKHALNVAILCSMMSSHLHFDYGKKEAVVTAALLTQIGLLDVPNIIAEKSSSLYTSEDMRNISTHLTSGFQLFFPQSNPYDLPERTMRILNQTTSFYYHPNNPLPVQTKWLPETKMIQVATQYDHLTSMHLDREPFSEIAAFMYLSAHQNYYDKGMVSVLTDCIHIVPKGACVQLSNGEKGMIVEANSKNIMAPIVLLFSNNKLYDLEQPATARKMQIIDLMKTMDNRIHIDEETLKHFKSDPLLQQTMELIRSKKKSKEFLYK
jgi:HD-GYP domain-containing protein (c-di-GMP phosphodiesterase class II)